MRNKRIMIILILVVTFILCVLLYACGKSKTDNKKTTAGTDLSSSHPKGSVRSQTVVSDRDIVTLLLPPITGEYLADLSAWVETFNLTNNHIEISISTASWESVDEKVDSLITEGNPPDIAFVGSSGLSLFVNRGVALDLSEYLTAEQISDFTPGILDYCKVSGGLYGLPLYCEVHSIGGNKKILERAGIDYAAVQKDGWSFEEFKETLLKGTTVTSDGSGNYGMVFACSGVASEDYFNIFSKCAGFPAEFTDDLKYTYTSGKMLKFLEDIRELVDNGSQPTYMNSIDADKRWEMFVTEKTMLIGKGLSSFEKNAEDNNKKITDRTGDEVAGSTEVHYAVLPVPVFNDIKGATYYAQAAVDAYVCLANAYDITNADEEKNEHFKNVAEVAYWLSSGERSAKTCSELYLEPVCISGEKEYEKLPEAGVRDSGNAACASMMMQYITPSMSNVPAEYIVKASNIHNEVIIPYFTSMLQGTATPYDVYQAIFDAGINAFGVEGCVVED